MDYNPKLTISKLPLFELEVNYDSLKSFLKNIESNQKEQETLLSELKHDRTLFNLVPKKLYLS